MGQDEKGKPTKHPYNPLNPQWKAKNSDSKTWNTFAKALEVASTDGFNGPGFVFSEKDPYTGIDLDKCRDPEIKEIEEWAANSFMNSTAIRKYRQAAWGFIFLSKESYLQADGKAAKSSFTINCDFSLSPETIFQACPGNQAPAKTA